MIEFIGLVVLVLFVMTMASLSKVSLLQKHVMDLRREVRELQKQRERTTAVDEAPEISGEIDTSIPAANVETAHSVHDEPLTPFTPGTSGPTTAETPVEPWVTQPPPLPRSPAPKPTSTSAAGPKETIPDQKEFQFMARWAPRVGIALGIAALVFFGVYIAIDTPPWVKFAQMVAVCLAVCGGGIFLLRRTHRLAVALIGAGLAGLYLTVLGGYAVPAIRVFPDVLTAALAQLAVIAILLTASIRLNTIGLATTGICAGFLGTQLLAIEGSIDGVLPAALLLAVVGLVLMPFKGWIIPAALAVILYLATFGVVTVTWSDHFSASPWLGAGPLLLLAAGWLACGRRLGRGPLVIKLLLISGVAVLTPVILRALDHTWFEGHIFAAMAALGAFAYMDNRRGSPVTAGWALIGGLLMVVVALVRYFEGELLVFLLAFQTLLLLLTSRRLAFPGLYPGLILSWVVTAWYALFFPLYAGVTVDMHSFLWPTLLALATLGLTANHIGPAPGKDQATDKDRLVPQLLAALLLVGSGVLFLQTDTVATLTWGAFAAVVVLVAVAWRAPRPYSLITALFILAIGVGFSAGSAELDTWLLRFPAWALIAIAVVASSLTERCQTALYCVVAFGLLQWIGWPHNCWIVPLIAAIVLFAPIPLQIRRPSIGPVFVVFATIQIFIDPTGSTTATALETFHVLQATLALGVIVWVAYSIRCNETERDNNSELTIPPGEPVIAASLLVVVGAILLEAGFNSAATHAPETLMLFGMALGFAALWTSRQLAFAVANIALAGAFLLAVTTDLELLRWILVALSFTALGIIHLRIHSKSTPTATLSPYYAFASLMSLIVGTLSFSGNPIVITPTWGLLSALLLIVGLKMEVRPLRVAGLIGIALSVVRLIGADLQDTFHRIVAFAVLASVCIFIGYLYQRKIKG